jgi:hypothetical protein
MLVLQPACPLRASELLVPQLSGHLVVEFSALCSVRIVQLVNGLKTGLRLALGPSFVSITTDKLNNLRTLGLGGGLALPFFPVSALVVAGGTCFMPVCGLGACLGVMAACGLRAGTGAGGGAIIMGAKPPGLTSSCLCGLASNAAAKAGGIIPFSVASLFLRSISPFEGRPRFFVLLIAGEGVVIVIGEPELVEDVGSISRLVRVSMPCFCRFESESGKISTNCRLLGTLGNGGWLRKD